MPVPVVAGAAGKEIMKQIATAAAIWGAGRVLDAMISPGPVFDNPDPTTPIGDQPHPQIINNISIRNDDDITQEQAVDTDIALATIAQEETSVDLLKARLGTITSDVDATTDAQIANANDASLDMMAMNGAPDKLDRDALTPESRKRMKQLNRGDSDRYLVSKEEHEYVYCRDAQKVEEVFLLAASPSQVPGTSYGRWVDSPKMRKAIALVRALKRVSHGKNSKAICTQLGTTRDELLAAFAQNTLTNQKLLEGCSEWNANA